MTWVRFESQPGPHRSHALPAWLETGPSDSACPSPALVPVEFEETSCNDLARQLALLQPTVRMDLQTWCATRTEAGASFGYINQC
eukprot:4753148-Amphidinium_carterae.1